MQLCVPTPYAIDSLQPAQRASNMQRKASRVELTLGLTKVANSLRRCALLEQAIRGACGAENPSTQPAMVPSCYKVERHITLVTGLDTVVG